ncbi:MAG: hypothetical protein ACYC99_12185 [Candidatus Geothermincolia bacterium]
MMGRAHLLRRTAVTGSILLAFLLVLLFALPAQASTWTREADNGITNTSNLHLAPGAIFQGKLPVAASAWVGIAGPGPASMYMYDGSTFTQVGANGFGNANIHGLHPSGVYGGDLYIGTANSTNGGELYSFNGTANPVKVPGTANGWGEGNINDTVIPLGVVNNKLVVSVSNRSGAVTGGLRLWTLSGSTWTQVVGPASAIPSGFGNTNNIASSWATNYHGSLIIPVLNQVTGLEVWSYNGTAFNRIGAPGAGTWSASQVAGMTAHSEVEDALYVGTLEPTTTIGAGLWRWNGTTWTMVVGGGIGDSDNGALQPLVRGGELFLSAMNATTGCQVYKRTPSGFTAVSSPGFDNTANNQAAFIANYGGKIVATTLNMAGGEVWTTPALSNVWFFAEGTTRSNTNDGVFEEWICLQNPNSAVANVELTYMLSDGTNQVQNTVVSANSRKTISVHEFLGPDKDVSTLVKSDQLILAERPMYFNYHNKWTGGHNVMGIPQPQTSWYFAEGTTRDNTIDGTYEEWLCLQNPGPEDTTVTVTYMLATGQNIEKTYPVAKTSRKTIDVNADVGANQDISMLVESDKAIVAERPMYFNYHNKWTGGDDVVGAARPATTFYFAEGTTRDNPTDGTFEEWICIQNPGTTDAAVEITYWTATAGNQTQDVTVPKQSRSTVDVKLKLGANVDSSFKIQSSVPIVVERPMYFNYHGVWAGGHDVMGCDLPRNMFFFAEGNTLSNFATYVAVLNPNAGTATVKFTFMIEGEANQQKTVTIPAEKRYTEYINAALPADKNVSIKVESDLPVVAERPMYFNYQGWCMGGSDTLGYGI